jgi:hypothetical protein
VALLTTIDFWWPTAGNRTAILALVRALQPKVALTLVTPLAPSPRDAARLAQQVPGLAVHTLALPPQGDRGAALQALAAFFRRHPQDACIVEYLSLAWMRPAIPPGVLTVLDTHDVASEYEAGLAAIGRLDRAPISPADERRQLDTFDLVTAISRPDAAVFSSWLGPARVVPLQPAWVPDPLPPAERPPGQARRLLFVGSRAAPNAEGLSWFLREVWPQLADLALQLDVVGGVGQGLDIGQAVGVQRHGMVAELRPWYGAADLCINPVRHGSGLKIKSVEALAYGRPLVATAHAARGLEPHAGRAFLVADHAAGFAQAIRMLLQNPAQARALAQEGLALVQREFEASRCYAPLLQALGAAPAAAEA